jgi:hypothetical protein
MSIRRDQHRRAAIVVATADGLLSRRAAARGGLL